MGKRFRPWIFNYRYSFWYVALLAFFLHNFSYHGKVIYAVVTYTLLLFYADNLPYSALNGVNVTGDEEKKQYMSSYRFVAVMFAQFCSGFMLGIIKCRKWGDKAVVGIEKSSQPLLAIVGTIMLLITFDYKRHYYFKTGTKSKHQGRFKWFDEKHGPWIIMLTWLH